MKIGNVVAYTPPGSPQTDGKPSFVVVGVIPETDADNELVWLCGVSNGYAQPEEPSIEESLDCTVVSE